MLPRSARSVLAISFSLSFYFPPPPASSFFYAVPPPPPPPLAASPDGGRDGVKPQRWLSDDRTEALRIIKAKQCRRSSDGRGRTRVRVEQVVCGTKDNTEWPGGGGGGASGG